MKMIPKISTSSIVMYLSKVGLDVVHEENPSAHQDWVITTLEASTLLVAFGQKVKKGAQIRIKRLSPIQFEITACKPAGSLALIKLIGAYLRSDLRLKATILSFHRSLIIDFLKEMFET